MATQAFIADPKLTIEVSAESFTDNYQITVNSETHSASATPTIGWCVSEFIEIKNPFDFDCVFDGLSKYSDRSYVYLFGDKTDESYLTNYDIYADGIKQIITTNIINRYNAKYFRLSFYASNKPAGHIYFRMGIKENPILCNSWDDLIAKNLQYKNQYLKLENGSDTVIDMNNEYPDGIESNIDINNHTDFNGLTIKNATVKTGIVIFRTIEKSEFNDYTNIYNLKMLDCLVENGSIFGSYFSIHNIICSCIINGTVNTSLNSVASVIRSNSFPTIFNSSFNIELQGPPTMSYAFYNNSSRNSVPLINNCRINIIDHRLTSEIKRAFYKCYFKDCLITGTIGKNGNLPAKSFKFIDDKICDCIIDLNAEQISDIIDISNLENVNIFNKDRITNPKDLSLYNIHSLTAAEMKDPEEYRKRGFPMGVD